MPERPTAHTPSPVGPAAVDWHHESLSGRVLPGYETLDPASLPWEQLAAGVPLPPAIVHGKVSRSRLVLGFPHPVTGERLFAKRAIERTLAKRLSSVFQGPKVFREWDLARAFLAADVPVPEPLLVAHGREARARVGYLVTRAFPGYWEKVSDAFRGEAFHAAGHWEELARFAARMHRRGVFHADFRADHVFLRDPASGGGFALLDLDGSTAGRPIPPWKRRKALIILFHTLRNKGLTLGHVRAFLELYDPAMVPDAEEFLQTARTWRD